MEQKWANAGINRRKLSVGGRLQRLFYLLAAEFLDEVVKVSSRGIKGFIGQHCLKLLVRFVIILDEKIIVTEQKSGTKVSWMLVDVVF